MLPQKYATLITAQKRGITVPDTLLVSPKTKTCEIKNFLKNYVADQLFIIRSAVSVEDGSNTSMAGHFWSSGAVVGQRLQDTIALAFKKNEQTMRAIDKTGDIFLLLQPYIHGKCGGVLFSPWKFYPDYFCGEITAGGAQDTVSGKNSDYFLLSKIDADSPVPMPKKWRCAQAALIKTVKQIDQAFDFSVDVEWICKDNDSIVVVQIRPATVSINALAPFPNKYCLPKGEWKKTSLAESLGCLSPLTYSLMQKLFADTIPLFQKLGFTAENADFFYRLPNGEILCDSILIQDFYRNGSFWSSFLRSFRKNAMLQETQKFCKSADFDLAFAYKTLLQIFQHWMTANTYANPEKHTHPRRNEYELSHYEHHFAKPEIKTDSWRDMRDSLRVCFFYELNKLKQQLAQKPRSSFMDFNEWETRAVSDAELITREKASASESIYDFSCVIRSQPNPHSTAQKVAGTGKISGKAFVLPNPLLFHGEFPGDCILVAPYFHNDWILEIDRFKGIIIEDGGTFSHSAIIAREKNIPYFIYVANAIDIYENGQVINLDCEEGAIHTA